MEGPIRVVVCGALGRMGTEVARAVIREKDMVLAGGADPKAKADYLEAPEADKPIPLAPTLSQLLERCRADVLVDFTNAEAAVENAKTAMTAGLACVVGTTGLSQQNVEEIRRLSEHHRRGAVVAPNFALGAVLMMHFAKIGAKYFDHAEIIELHHDGKLDAPSGTAISTAQSMEAVRGGEMVHPPTLKEVLRNVRGGSVGGVGIHSVRLPGLVAHQEVIFGGMGQTLTIRHDSISRESFLPGVLMAIRHVAKAPDFIYGLDELMGLH